MQFNPKSMRVRSLALKGPPMPPRISAYVSEDPQSLYVARTPNIRGIGGENCTSFRVGGHKLQGRATARSKPIPVTGVTGASISPLRSDPHVALAESLPADAALSIEQRRPPCSTLASTARGRSNHPPTSRARTEGTPPQRSTSNSRRGTPRCRCLMRWPAALASVATATLRRPAPLRTCRYIHGSAFAACSSPLCQERVKDAGSGPRRVPGLHRVGATKRP